MKELLKTVDAAAKTKTKKAAAPKTVKRTKFGFVPEKGAPYDTLKADHTVFAAFTMAAAIHAGLVNMPAKGALTSGKKTDMELFRAIVGPRASGYWTDTGRIERNTLTAKGLNEFGRRLEGIGSYKTTRERVNEVLALVRKGGAMKVKGTEVKFAYKVPKA